MGLLYSLRALGRKPALVVSVLVTLGLGVGANTALLGLVAALQSWEPEHVADPSRLVTVGAARNFVEYRELRDRARTLDVGAYSRTSHGIADGMGGGGAILAEIEVECVTGSYLSVLGVRPRLGRGFRQDGADADRERLALLSEGFWMRHHGGDTTVVGSQLRFGGTTFRIVGVMPRGFRGVEPAAVDVWIPLASAPELCSYTGDDLTASAASYWLSTIGRLRDGVSPAAAAAEVASLLASSTVGQGTGTTPPEARLVPVGRTSRDMVWQAVVAGRLAAGAAAIFLIACVNVTLLLGIHVAGRRREIALRRQLGASRWRVAAQAFTDSALLAGAGGVLALLVAHWILVALRNVFPSVDTRVIGNAPLVGLLVAFVAAAALLSGVLPALRASRVGAGATLGGEAGVSGRRSSGLRTVLAVQLALGLALAVVTGLVVRSVINLTADIGYQVDNVIVGTFDLAGARGAGTAPMLPLQDELIGRLERLPDVESVSLAFGPMLSSGGTIRMAPVRAGQSERIEMALFNVVTRDYFATLGTGIVRGRHFGPHDTMAEDPVAIVDEGVARRLWPGGEARGQCISVFSVPCVTVIGVSEARRQAGLTGSAPEVFVPFSQVTLYDAGIMPQALFIRHERERVGAIVAAARALSAQLPLRSVRPLRDLVDDQTRSRRLAAVFFGLFSVMAIVLSCVGAHAVAGEVVRRRKREFGIRLAVGAAPRHVLRLVFGEAIVALAAGWLLGCLSSVAVARSLDHLLFNVSAVDPATLSVASLMLGLAVLVGCLAPAVQALRVDPAITLREL